MMEEDEMQNLQALLEKSLSSKNTDYIFDKFDTNSFVDLGYIQASNYNYP